MERDILEESAMLVSPTGQKVFPREEVDWELPDLETSSADFAISLEDLLLEHPFYFVDPHSKIRRAPGSPIHSVSQPSHQPSLPELDDLSLRRGKRITVQSPNGTIAEISDPAKVVNGTDWKDD